MIEIVEYILVVNIVLSAQKLDFAPFYMRMNF